MGSFVTALPGAVSQGLIWGIMAIGVYITYKILDIADLTVDGSFCTGGAAFVVLFSGGMNVWLALLISFAVGLLAGLVTGILHTFCGIPAILAGILTQLGLYSINLAIMGMNAMASIGINDKNVLDRLLVSLRFVTDVSNGERPFWMHRLHLWGCCLWPALSRCCIGSSAPSWDAPCGRPVPTAIWRRRRASIPTLRKCWG